MCEFWIHVLEEFTANLVLAISLIVFNEKIFPKYNISGEWDTNLTYDKTSHHDFLGIQIQYKINLLQQGNIITGHGEKVSDINTERGLYEFERDKRVHIEVNGYYERNFIKKSIIYLNVVEKGRIRDTSQTFVLCYEGKSKLIGKFTSTAADSSGPITMNKNDLGI